MAVVPGPPLKLQPVDPGCLPSAGGYVDIEIADGVALVAWGNGGEVIAVDVDTGARLWSRPANTGWGLGAGAGRFFLVDGAPACLEARSAKVEWELPHHWHFPVSTDAVCSPDSQMVFFGTAAWAGPGVDADPEDPWQGDPPRLYALRADSGQLVWSHSGSPTDYGVHGVAVDDKRAYCLFTDRLIAFGRNDGHVVWEQLVSGDDIVLTPKLVLVSCGTEVRAFSRETGRQRWVARITGENESLHDARPALSGGRLIMAVQEGHGPSHPPVATVAINTASGEEVWRSGFVPFGMPDRVLASEKFVVCRPRDVYDQVVLLDPENGNTLRRLRFQGLLWLWGAPRLVGDRLICAHVRPDGVHLGVVNLAKELQRA